MVIRKVHPLGWWISIAVILFLISIGLPLGVNIWYTNSVVSHDCQALNLILAQPAPKPVNPNANPSRVFAYNFHQDIAQWAKSDGC